MKNHYSAKNCAMTISAMLTALSLSACGGQTSQNQTESSETVDSTVLATAQEIVQDVMQQAVKAPYRFVFNIKSNGINGIWLGDPKNTNITECNKLVWEWLKTDPEAQTEAGQQIESQMVATKPNGDIMVRVTQVANESNAAQKVFKYYTNIEGLETLFDVVITYESAESNRVVKRECREFDDNGQLSNLQMSTYTYDANGRMEKEEYTDQHGYICKIVTENRFYPNGKISQTKTVSTDVDGTEYTGLYNYDENGHLRSQRVETLDATLNEEIQVEPNDLGGADTIRSSQVIECLSTRTERFDGRGYLRMVETAETCNGHKMDGTKMTWPAMPDNLDANTNIRIVGQGTEKGLAKTVFGTNGTSADYYMYDGDQWIEWTSCQAEKKVDGQWQADNVRRAISILDIAKLLGN